MERNELCFCGSGRKYKKCHIPINEKSKIAKVYQRIVKYDNYVNESNIKNQCVKGCNDCCRDYFYIDEIEFLLILDRIISKDKKLVDYYHEKGIEYEMIFKSNYPAEYAKLDSLMQTSNNIMNRLSYYQDDGLRKLKIQCIFMAESGKCEIYDWRPVICRSYGSTTKCELINNDGIVCDELTDLVNETQFINGKYDKISNRPYPLFYWFSIFLIPEFRKLTLDKVKKACELKEEDYQKYKYGLQF